MKIFLKWSNKSEINVIVNCNMKENGFNFLGLINIKDFLFFF